MSKLNKQSKENATGMIKSLNRPVTTQSRSQSSWSTHKNQDKQRIHSSSDVEMGGITGAKSQSNAIDAALAEELAKEEIRETKREEEPKGCWDILASYVSSIWLGPFWKYILPIVITLEFNIFL